MADTSDYRILCDENKTRMQTLYNTWERISVNPTIPEEAACQIKSVLGQTQLLINKKFTFFDNFLTKAEEQKELQVNNNDLHGLWDMVNIEIEGLDAKYAELEQLKKNNWKRPAVDSKSPKKQYLKKTPGCSPVKTPRGLVKSSATASAETSTTRTTPNRPKSSFVKPTPKATVPSRPKSSLSKVASPGTPVCNPRSTYTIATPSKMTSSSTPFSAPGPKASTKSPRKVPVKSQTNDSTETVPRETTSNADVQSSESEEYFDALSSLNY